VALSTYITFKEINVGWPRCKNGTTSYPKEGTRKLFWRRKASGETTKYMGRCHAEGCSQPAPDSELEGCSKKLGGVEEEGWGGEDGPKRHRRRRRRNEK
jgi:hypothetical protein